MCEAQKESPAWMAIRGLSPRIRTLLHEGDIRHAASVSIVKYHLSDKYWRRVHLTAEDRRLVMAAHLDGARGAVIAAAIRLSSKDIPVRVLPLPVEWWFVVSRVDSIFAPEPTQ